MLTTLLHPIRTLRRRRLRQAAETAAYLAWVAELSSTRARF